MFLLKAAILVIGLAVIVGWFHQHLVVFFNNMLLLLQEPCRFLSSGLTAVMASLRAWIRAQMGHEATQAQPANRSGETLSSDGPATAWNPLDAHDGATARAVTAQETALPAPGGSALSPRQHLLYIIGSILYTLACVAFLYAEVWLILLILRAWGFESAGMEPPASAGVLTAASLVGAAFFWGLFLLDLLGVTDLAPWHRLSPKARRVALWLAISCIVLSAGIALLMGLWGGAAATQTEPATVTVGDGVAAGAIEAASPGREVAHRPGQETAEVAFDSLPGSDAIGSSFERNIPKVSMGLLRVLVAVSAAWSGIGVVILFNYLVVILAGAILIPMALVDLTMRIIMVLCNAAFGAIQAILLLLHSMGRGLLDFFRPLYNWLQARMKRSLGEGGNPPPLPPAQAGVHEPPATEPDLPTSDSPEQSQTDEADETQESEESATAWNPFAMTGGPR